MITYDHVWLLDPVNGYDGLAVVNGTHLAPEQLGGSVGLSTDAWGLGVTAYRALCCGFAPYPTCERGARETDFEFLIRVREEYARLAHTHAKSGPHARALNPEVWPELDETVARLLAIDRSARAAVADFVCVADDAERRQWGRNWRRWFLTL